MFRRSIIIHLLMLYHEAMPQDHAAQGNGTGMIASRRFIEVQWMYDLIDFLDDIEEVFCVLDNYRMVYIEE